MPHTINDIQPVMFANLLHKYEIPEHTITTAIHFNTFFIRFHTFTSRHLDAYIGTNTDSFKTRYELLTIAIAYIPISVNFKNVNTVQVLATASTKVTSVGTLILLTTVKVLARPLLPKDRYKGSIAQIDKICNVDESKVGIHKA